MPRNNKREDGDFITSLDKKIKSGENKYRKSSNYNE